MVNNILLDSKVDTHVRISGFEGGNDLTRKLHQYGLYIGDRARIVRLAPFHGPLLIEVNGREIAIGRGIAAKIKVEAA